jgi:hypothetical protein
MQHDEALIGERHTEYYQKRFALFDKRGGRYFPTWNWPAFLFMGVWALYRRMNGNFWKFAVFFGPASFLEEILGEEGIFILMWIATAIFYGLTGDFYYYRHIRSLEEKIDPDASEDALRQKGGVKAWVPYVFGTVGAIALLGVAVWSTLDYVEKSQHRSTLYKPRN